MQELSLEDLLNETDVLDGLNEPELAGLMDDHDKPGMHRVEIVEKNHFDLRYLKITNYLFYETYIYLVCQKFLLTRVTNP